MIYSLPTGTITFLFTDIEGSTQLWENQPEAMKAALKRHDGLLRDIILSHKGYVFKTVGDAFCAAFANAPDALYAALGVQRALNAEAWPPEVGPLRVRMGLHTGAAEERDNDYFGPTVNRTARLQAAAHGGQILLSLSTEELVRDDLPAGVQLTHLGRFRLKDLFRPEVIYQVAAADLQADFPPLRTLDARLHNLPTQATPFIGREREVAAVLNLLRHHDVRLITLTGAGGTGKTRLSLQVAADLVDEYEHGVWFVELAAVRDPQLVLPTIASTLKVKEIAGEPLADTLKSYLANKEMLLVLDNIEQVVEASPRIGDLLTPTTRLKFIISSREVLRIYGEHDYPVPPLSLPEKKRRQTIAVLSQYEAVRLFIGRAQAARPDFRITEENAPAIAEVCIRLDGLPLAIELAAARSRMLTPQAILERLNNRLALLTGGARNLPTRQQTLRNAIDWSYDLLNSDEKKLLARLGVFSGGWSLEAAETICGSGLQVDMLGGLESLLDKSLIRETSGPNDTLRFGMLDTIREYAVERLAQSPEQDILSERHAAYFVKMAELNDNDALRETKDFTSVYERLQVEQDNIRAALSWSLDAGKPEAALRIGAALWFSWTLSGQVTEGRRWLVQALKPGLDIPPRLRAGALRAAANLAFSQRDFTHMRDAYEEVLALYREAGDERNVAACLNNLGNYYELFEHDLAQAGAHFEQSLGLSRKLGYERGMLAPLQNLSILASGRGDKGQARAYAEEALALARRLGNGDGIGSSLSCLAWVAYKEGNFAEAFSLSCENLKMAHRNRVMVPIAIVMRMMGIFSAVQGNHRRAACLFAFSMAMVPDTDMGHPGEPTQERDRLIPILREALGQPDFDAAWAEGEALSVDAAVEYALVETRH